MDKLNAKAARVLRKLERTGKIANANVEPFLQGDFIQFGGPRPEVGQEFNCYHLTPRGKAALATGEVLAMSSYIVTILDRERDDPNKRALREFEVVGNRSSAFRAAARAASETPGAYAFEVERA